MNVRIKGAALAASALMGILPAAVAEETSNAYHFLDIPTSSHVMGLGGNNICVIEDDVSLADQNPALIGPELDMQVNVNYMYYMGSSNFAGVRYGMAAGDHGAWAVGLRSVPLPEHSPLPTWWWKAHIRATSPTVGAEVSI